MNEATVAGLFSGQGLRAGELLVGLDAGDIYLEKAEELLGYPLRRRVFVATRSVGGRVPTSVAQPAIFVAGALSWRRRREAGQTFDYLAGYGLGEYAALVASGALAFEDALVAVGVRGEAMHSVSQSVGGAMAAVTGVDLEQIRDIAAHAGVWLAGDDAPGRVVVSGREDGLAEAARLVASAGGRCLLLEVSGPFHTPLMAPAAQALADALDRVEIRAPDVPVVSNVTARPYFSGDEVRSLLVEQLTKPVRFRESIEWLWEQGARDYEHLGPGDMTREVVSRTVQELEVAGV